MSDKHNKKKNTTESEKEEPTGEVKNPSAEQQSDEELPVEEHPEEELPEVEPQPEKKEPTELEKAQALAEDYKRKWYSVSAEYDNYRKRTAAQASQAYADGKAEAILKLLPVADTFGYALDAAKDDATKAGIDKIIKNFNNILNSLGVEEVAINVGDKFDETVAEAVMNAPCGEGEEPNTVKLVLKKGYRQGGKVIRFAQVSVTV